MASVNKVILVGHLGKDPEIKTAQTGLRIATLSVATSDIWTDKRPGASRADRRQQAPIRPAQDRPSAGIKMPTSQHLCCQSHHPARPAQPEGWEHPETGQK